MYAIVFVVKLTFVDFLKKLKGPMIADLDFVIIWCVVAKE